MSEKKSNEAKSSLKKTVYLQFCGKEVSLDEVEGAIKENYDIEKKGKDPAFDIKIYLKPEDDRAYYVINNDYAGDVALMPKEAE